MAENFKLKIENVRDTHENCIPLLEKWFTHFGIKELDPPKKMEYWSIKGEDSSLLNESVLATDESGNELRAVFLLTRKQKCKKTELFRFTELFDSLPMIEKDVSILEVLDIFAEGKPEYLRPTSVVCLGSIEEEGIFYSGCFLLNVPPLDIPTESEVPDPELKNIKKIRKNM